MKHLIQAVTLLLLASPAFAQSATGSIAATRPTTNSDGSTLAASDIAGYTWSCQFTPTGGNAAPCAGFSGGTVTGSNPNTTVTFTAPAAGGKACFSGVTRTVAGMVSAPSAITAASCKDIAPSIPNPPGNVQVTVTLTLNLTSASPVTVALAGPPVVTVSP